MALLYKSDSKIDASDLAIFVQIRQRVLDPHYSPIECSPLDIASSLKEFVVLIRLNKIELGSSCRAGSPQRPAARLEESFGKETKKHYVLLKTLNSDDIRDFTFRDFCELREKVGNQFADDFIKEYLRLIESLPAAEQKPAFADFLGNDTYTQLSNSGGLRFIICYDAVRRLAPDHPLLRQASLADSQSLINEFKVFEQADNFLIEGIAHFRYGTLDTIEGYWVDDYRCEKAYQHAEQKRVDIKTDEQKRRLMLEVQEIILREEKISDSHRLPVPEEKPWPGATALINCLKFFEARASEMPEESKGASENICGVNQLRYLLSADQIEQFRPLLNVRVREVPRSGGPGAILRLPPLNPQENIHTFRDASVEYEIKLNDGVLVRWTSTLKNYIRDWNIIPARQFLLCFQQLVREYREEYIPRLPRLQQILNEHRARVEQEQATDVSARRLVSSRPPAAPAMPSPSAMPSVDARSVAVVITTGTGAYGGAVSTTASIPAETPLLPRDDKQQTNCWPRCALL